MNTVKQSETLTKQWLDKYYPIKADKAVKIVSKLYKGQDDFINLILTAFALKKWEGLTKYILDKHKLTFDKYYISIVALKDIKNNTILYISASTCTLCILNTQAKDSLINCDNCPITKITESPCDKYNITRDKYDTRSPWSNFSLLFDPAPMISTLTTVYNALLSEIDIDHHEVQRILYDITNLTNKGDSNE